MSIIPWVPWILGGLGVIWLIFLVWLFRNKSLLLSSELTAEQTKTAAGTRRDQHRETLNNRLNELHEAHRHETIEDQAHLADRTDFDNDWGGLPRPGSDTSTGGAESSGTTGTAGDIGDRAGLSD